MRCARHIISLVPNVDDVPIRGEVRRVGFRRVSHGLFVTVRAGLTADEEFARDLEAWRLVLPPGAVFTHVTGARLLGWRLPRLPEQVPVFAAVAEHQPRPRRPGLSCSRLRRESVPVPGHRFPVDLPEEILLRASRDLGVLDVLIMLDSALSLGHVTVASVGEIIRSGRPGVRALAAALQLADGRSESAGETVLRMFLRAIEVDVESQVALRDAHGRVMARADFLVRRTRKVLEYDGEGHRDLRQHRRDLRRERTMSVSAFERSGYSLDDLLNHPAATMHDVDRLLGRPHISARLTRWRQLVSGSLYDPDGRQRVTNRWRRAMGVTDWS